MFSLNVHDPSLSYSMQTTSIKLLLNLIEGIIHRNDAEGKGRVLLVRIMDTIVNKFVTLKDRIPKLLVTYKAHMEKPAGSRGRATDTSDGVSAEVISNRFGFSLYNPVSKAVCAGLERD